MASGPPCYSVTDEEVAYTASRCQPFRAPSAPVYYRVSVLNFKNYSPSLRLGRLYTARRSGQPPNALRFPRITLGEDVSFTPKKSH